MRVFFDIETIPDGEPIDAATLEPPSTMSKPETIAKWREEKAPAIALEQYKKRALDSMAGKIICIGYAVEDEPVNILMGDDRAILQAFNAVLLDGTNGGLNRMLLEFVGWNVRSFDVPWIWRHAIRLGMPELARMFKRERYKGNIVDLMELWAADFRDYRKMDDVARFLTVGEPVGSGADVYEQFCAGDFDAIEAHCKQDVELVRGIYNAII